LEDEYGDDVVDAHMVVAVARIDVSARFRSSGHLLHSPLYQNCVWSYSGPHN